MDGSKPMTMFKSTVPEPPQHQHIFCSHLAENTHEPALSHFTYREPAVPNRDSPTGAGGLTVRLALCSGPPALQACSTAVTHTHPKSTLQKVCSHLCALPPARRVQLPRQAADPNRQSLPGAPTPGQSASGTSLPLPMTCTLSFGAGCCGNRWHGLSRSSPDRAGNCGIAGSGSGTPSCSRCGSRNTQQDGRLWERDAKL